MSNYKKNRALKLATIGFVISMTLLTFGHTVDATSSITWVSATNINGSGALSSVSCPTTTFCMATDTTGGALRYNGTSWAGLGDIDGAHVISSVSCPTTTFCMAVDESGYALSYNGTSWTTATDVDPSRGLVSVSCPVDNFCMASDTSGYALSYSVTMWGTASDVDSSRNLSSVSCTSSSFCMGVDTSGYALSYNGTSWTTATDVDSTRNLNSVSCTSTTFCMAVGGGGYVLSYNGTVWTTPTDVDATDNITSVSCVTLFFCEAVDGSGYSVNYYPTSWQSTTLVNSGKVLASVSCPNSGFCIAVDGSGNAYGGTGPNVSSNLTPTVTVDSGPLGFYVAPAGVTFPPETLTGINQTSGESTTQTLVIGDDTGTGAGWNVVLSNTPFTNGTQTLPNSDFSAVNPTDECYLSPPVCLVAVWSGNVTYPYTLPGGTGTEFLSAEAGTGMVPQTVSITWDLAALNAGTAGGTYSSTWTLTLSSGP